MMTEDQIWDRISEAFPGDDFQAFIDHVITPSMSKAYAQARNDAADAIGAHARTRILANAKAPDLKVSAAFTTAERIARTGAPE